MRKSLLFFVSFSALFAKEYDLTTLIKKGVENNSELRIKALEQQIAEENVKTLDGIDKGKLVLSETLTRTNNALNAFGSKLSARNVTATDFVPSTLNALPSQNGFDLALSYDYPLFTGFKLHYLKNSAKLAAQAKELLLQNDKKVLENTISHTFYEAKSALALANAAKSALEATEKMTFNANALKSAGMATESDVLQAQSSHLKAQNAYQSAMGNYKGALAYLTFLTGIMDLDNLGEGITLSPFSSNLETLITQALSKREDIRALETTLKAYKEGAKAEESSRYPQAIFQARYGFYDNKPLFGGFSQDYYTLGIGLNYTLYDGGYEKANRQKATLAAQKAMLTLENAKKGLRSTLTSLYYHFEALTHTITFSDTVRRNAELVLANTQIAYTNGLVPMSTLTLKHAEYEEAKAAHIQATYQQKQLHTEILKTLGLSMTHEETP